MQYCPVGIRGRIASCLVLLGALLGTPVVPVICDLACPAEVVEIEADRLAATHTTAPSCHQSPGDASDGAARASGDTLSLVLTPVGSLACQHPVVVVPPVVDGPRFASPTVLSWSAVPRVDWLQRAPLARLRPTRSVWPPPSAGGAFPLVLRI